ncbi:MAG: DNA polymerase I [Chlorobi bacterium]|nr:DNA polymerase I [Chlorobiota bacterium]MCI0716730.1 DNA polymerase I [Chlorobiota bacterium]
MLKRLFLIDGMALAYRAYFSLIRTPLISSKGLNTSAIFGFINTLNKLIDDEKPDYIAVAFDTDKPTFRHKQYKEYKATREAMPDDLVPQIDKIKEVISAFNIPMIELHGYEADDIIGTLVKRAEKEGVISFMVTADKDYMQLIDKNIKLYKPTRSAQGRQISDVEIIGVDGVKERFGVTPDRITDILALMGDKVDNIPGIPGIGEKTASALIQEYDSLDNLYKNIDKITKPKLKENLITHKDNAYLSKELATIHIEVPLDVDFHKLTYSEKNVALLEKIYTELEFKSLLKKLIGSSEQGLNIQAVSVEQPGETKPAEPQKLQDINSYPHKYYTIKNDEEFKRLCKKLNTLDEFSFDTETLSEEPIGAELVGLSFSYDEGEAFYVPLKYKEKQETDLFGQPVSGEPSAEGELPDVNLDTVINELKPVLEDKKIAKIGQNIKYDMLVMKKYGINFQNIGFDTMLAAYVLKPESNYKLDYLSESYLNYKSISFDDLTSTSKASIHLTMDQVSYKEVSDYAAEDADVTLRLYHRLEYELKKISLDNLCREIEFPLIEVLADMEYTGVKIDTGILSEINEELKSAEKRLEFEIHKLAGVQFNINSTKQLSDVLFNKLNLAAKKKIKTGFSTDTGVLEELAEEHPIAVKLLDYRTVTKLRSTYTEGLMAIINKKTAKVHTSFNQTVAATGRLSSANPNLQNIPIRTEIGRSLRKAFVPEKKGNLILSADYSQIELRIMAHLANDEKMIKAFEKNKDIHAETASRIFKVKMDKVDQNMRRKAKEVNFGLIYGIQAFGLAQRLNIDQREARDIIQSYFANFPTVNQWLEKTREFARKNGYTETLAGRRRYLQNINNKNTVVRQRDERIAINMPVQGTAADMIKIAMIDIYEEFKKRKLKSKMILQVHDELVFDCEKDELETVKKIVENKMKHAIKLNAPVDVETGEGINWFEAHA